MVDTKGHQGDRVLFSKWNSFSRIGVYERAHGDWSLSAAYNGPLPDTRFMDIDSAASTPILQLDADLSNAQYLRYELTALAYHLKENVAAGSGLADPRLLGARHRPGRRTRPGVGAGVRRASRRRRRDQPDHRQRRDARTGSAHSPAASTRNPRVRVTVDDGRSFVRRTPERYDVIQASLVDTWAATAAGAYTLTENTLYTVEAFNDYLDHLTDDGVLTITRWVSTACGSSRSRRRRARARGWPSADRLAIVRQDRVATFLLKKTPFTAAEIAQLREAADRLGFDVLYMPAPPATPSPFARARRNSRRHR